MKENKSIIFFDGICNLCNRSVKLIIKNDSRKKFLFSSLQSNFAQRKLNHENIKYLTSIILLDDGRLYFKSDAALKIAKELRPLFRLLYILILVPRPIRDFVYDIIAKNRYKWFGKQSNCMIPNEEIKDIFLQ